MLIIFTPYRNQLLSILSEENFENDKLTIGTCFFRFELAQGTCKKKKNKIEGQKEILDSTCIMSAGIRTISISARSETEVQAKKYLLTCRHSREGWPL